MRKLTHDQLRSRLEFDYRIATAMSNATVSIEAFRSAKNLSQRRSPISDKSDEANATHYRVEYRIKSLVGAGRYHDNFVVSLDLLANGNYPYSEPACFVISRPMPWTPHFAPNLPICTGELWGDLAGHATVGHLILHVAKLLNFDEPERSPGYAGYNGRAVAYWKKTFKGQPITPGLVYPTLSPELTHDAPVSAGSLFRASASAAPSTKSFRAGSPTSVFRPVQEA